MRRRTAIAAGALAALLLCGGPASGAAYFGYDQWGGTWHDADKTPGRTDETYLCWGASAANVLAWGGWTTPALDSATTIFQTFRDHWTDETSLEDRAWRWWLTGAEPRDPPGWARVATPGGGYFAREAGDFDRLYRASLVPGEAMGAVDRFLRDGYGVTLAIFPNTRAGGHALTAWGFDYDPGSGRYTGLWVTDSDDGNWTDRGLTFLPVAYDEIFHWWTFDDPADHAYDGWHIAGVQGLYNNFGGPPGRPAAGGGAVPVAGIEPAAGGRIAVPEPGTPALLAAGLLVLGLCRCAGRRRARRAPAAAPRSHGRLRNDVAEKRMTG